MDGQERSRRRDEWSRYDNSANESAAKFVDHVVQRVRQRLNILAIGRRHDGVFQLGRDLEQHTVGLLLRHHHCIARFARHWQRPHRLREGDGGIGSDLRQLIEQRVEALVTGNQSETPAVLMGSQEPSGTLGARERHVAQPLLAKAA